MNCKNKKIISILIASGILLSPNNAQAMESMVDFINEDSKAIEENIDKIEKEEAIQSEDDTNIVPGLVHEIILGEGEFVPDLTNNPKGYETIKVKTTGNKKLVAQDYINLRYSRIPKIDLSSAQSDSIPAGAFNSSSALKEFKFPKGITSIGDEAFMSCYGLTGKLELPDTVTTIGNLAFYSCSGLSGNLELPNSLISIGERAFVSCSGFSGDLVIPDSVETIEDNAFTYCDGFNGNLKLSNSLKSIGANAFVSLKGLSGELIIPDSIEFIGESAFEDCTGFSGDLVIPNSLKSLSDGVFAGCTGFDGTLKLPDTLETIGFATFNGCAGFKGKLVIPNSVKTIGNRAFGYCKGFSGDLIIPDSVTTIGTYSFNGCKGLDGTLKLSDSLTDIGIGAFYKCSGLSGELKLPNTITNIGMYAFNECSGLTGDLVIPNSLATLGNNAFRNTNLDKIFIKVNSEDKITDYRKSIIDVLPTKAKIIIDTPYNFDISKTWLENTDKIIAKPVVRNLVNGVESELVNGKGEKVSLYIPSIYEESNITVLKDGKVFNLPIKNDDKYIFTEEGNYEVTIKTSLGNVSVINFEVNNEVINIDKENPEIDYKLSTNDWTNENATITVNASDNVGIEKIILPDNSEVNASTTTYEVSQNGDYEFTAVDKSGNRKNIIVRVNNIDKECPNISYKTIEDKGDSVIVQFEMKDSLSGIKSITNDKGLTSIDGNKFELIKNVQYTFTVTDNAGNTNTIKILEEKQEDNNGSNSGEIVPPTQNPVEFNDIKGHWAEKTIKEFTDKKFIDGYKDNTFKPNNNMTRAEFVKVVNKVFRYTQKGEEKFTDVNKGDWFYDDICIGIKEGYIKGKSKDIFAPNENITREEAAMILTNIMNNKDDKLDRLNTFKDGNKTSQWAQSSVEGAIEAGYLKGDNQGLLNPTKNITRAEAISMLSRVNQIKK